MLSTNPIVPTTITHRMHTSFVNVDRIGLVAYMMTEPVASHSRKLLNAASSLPGNKIPLRAETGQREKRTGS